MNEQLSLLLGLGPNAEWPYTETSLIEIIKLQRDKEITKQQYYKSENLKKSIELLSRAKDSNIPSYLIPTIFSGEIPNQDLIVKLQNDVEKSTLSQKQPDPYTYPQPQPQPQPSSSSISKRPLYADYNTSNPPNPPNPPIHQQQFQVQHSSTSSPYPFKPQNPSALGPPVALNRSLSPAKIGAAAVAQLDRGRFPSSPMHRRNQSLPGSFSRSPSRTPHRSTSQRDYQDSPQLSQQKMMGTMNSIQFINENPGRKRRRASLELPTREPTEEAELSGSESNKTEENKENQTNHITNSNLNKNQSIESHKPSHSRIKSEHILLVRKDDKLGNDSPSIQVRPMSGPKFANNILGT
ncbi:hypothetical protein WICMUC_000240 [Wickerhamomyces mucosus]|uniref:Uncharacterized protein n=1 Tax=Wickerhamomyces mucosus TaxID=1378264 RepID=A0A9P8TIZ5_9ASCO|nr:hypothetical protein WICMUC_000240 [Wickerhamomyces mucosus]